MKFFLICLLIMTLPVFAQNDSCVNISDTTDIFDGHRTFQFKDEPISKTVKFSAAGAIGLAKSLKMFMLFFVSSKITGTDDKSAITVLFRDGSKEDFKNSQQWNLKGAYGIDFFSDYKMDLKQLDQLLHKKIKAIRLVGMSVDDSFIIDEDISNMISQKLNCLYDKWILAK